MKSDWKAWGVPFDPPHGVRQEDQDREGETEYIGGQPERIAEDWARQHDFSTTEYHIVKGKDYLVTVENLHSDERWKFRVSGESRPVYRVEEIRPSMFEGAPHG